MFALLIPLGYLLQVCFMPYIRIYGVTPSLLYANIAIVTVAYGRIQALWAGLIYGLLMEVMLPSVPYVNLALYPVSTLFCSFAFADKSLKTLEYERATSKKTRELPAWLRTVLCTALNTLIYEVVNVTYIYVGGSALLSGHIIKAVGDVLLTSVLCLILLFPLRRMILGRKTGNLVLKSAPVVFRRN